MVTYYLIGTAAVFFLAGIVFLYRGLRSRGDESDIVPISDINEIKNLQVELASVEKPQESQPQEEPNESNEENPEPVDVPMPVVQPEVSTAEGDLQQQIAILKEQLAQQTKQAQEQIEQLNAEKAKLKEGLQRESSSYETKTLSQEEQKSYQANEERIQQAEGSIARLSAENHRLNKQIAQQSIKLNEFQGSPKSSQQQADDNVQIKALQDEIVQFKAEKERLSGDLAALGEMKNVHGQLQQKHSDSLQEIKKLQDKLNVLQEAQASTEAHEDVSSKELGVENQKLQERVKAQEKEVLELKAQLVTLTKANEEQLKELNELIKKLQTAQRPLEPKEDLIPLDAQALSNAAMDDLKKEKESLFKMKEGLEQSNKEIKKCNEELEQQEKMLQYELAKSRAQSMGLEKICEDLKVQIEDMTKTIPQ